MQLDLGKLSAVELKELFVAVRDERERRGKHNPSNHDPIQWAVPNKALAKPPKVDSPSP